MDSGDLQEEHLSLQVHGWIPIRVVEDDTVGTRQVDANTARPRAEDKNKIFWVAIEPCHEFLALCRLGGSIQAHVHVCMKVEEDLEDIQHLGHLREDQAPAALCLEALQQHCQLLQFSCTHAQK